MNKQLPMIRATTSETLLVHSIFQTIQGEGPYAGRPAVFLRLAGCNLQCPGCDTEYTDGATSKNLAEVALGILTVASKGTNLLVITGGEPARQAIALSAFVQRFLDLHLHWSVQIETNGTLPFTPATLAQADVVVSPKTGRIDPHVAATAVAYKYVLAAKNVDPADGLPTSALDSGVRPARPPADYTGRIYVQPYDQHAHTVATAANTRAAVLSCMEYGYTFCPQIHKLSDLP